MKTFGISSGFPLLFRSPGQVPHVLRTRSPLGLHWCCHQMDLVRLACVKHAASVRPEPGSNSPSRNDRLPKQTGHSLENSGSSGRNLPLAADPDSPGWDPGMELMW
jgi:hypothetical protein